MKKIILSMLLCVCFSMVLAAYPVYATGKLEFDSTTINGSGGIIIGIGENDPEKMNSGKIDIGKTDTEIKGPGKIDSGIISIDGPDDYKLPSVKPAPPVITGIEDGGIYIGERFVTVTVDSSIDEVTVNGRIVTAEGNQFVLYPAYGEQHVIVRDVGGLTTEVTVTVYDEDTYNIMCLEQSWNGIVGWQEINGKLYYFNENGTIKTGWVRDTDGCWYYMGNDGSMVNGWVKTPISSKWYYMDQKDGHMLTDCWQCDPVSNRWYYFDKDGAMCTGWKLFFDNTWYLFDENGAMCTGWNIVNGAWYYFDKSGKMLTGRQFIDGFYYYLENGACLFNTLTWDGFWVDENGRYIGR